MKFQRERVTRTGCWCLQFGLVTALMWLACFSSPSSASQLLDGPFPTTSYSNPFMVQVSPDNHWATYQSFLGEPLFLVALDGEHAPVQLFGADPNESIDPHFQTTNAPGGVWVVFIEVGDLYSVYVERAFDGSPVVGSPVNLFDETATESLTFNLFQVGPHVEPGGPRVVYLMQDPGGPPEPDLFSIPISGGSPVRLTTGLDVADYRLPVITPDGQWVVFQADGGNLYSVAIDGSGGLLQLNQSLVGGGAAETWRITPDGSRVVYVADDGTEFGKGIYSAAVRRDPIDPPNPVRLNFPASAGINIFFTMSQDGSYAGYHRVSNFDCRVAPVDGSAPPAILGSCTNLKISEDGSRIVGDVFDGGTGDIRLASMPTDGSTSPVWVSGPYSVRNYGNSFDISPDGTRIAFAGRSVIAGNPLGYLDSRVYSAPADGSGTPVQLDSSDFYGSEAGSVRITPDGSRVLYLASRHYVGFEVAPPEELYIAPIATPGGSRKLNLPIIGLWGVGTKNVDSEYYDIERDDSPYLVSPDGHQVVYIAEYPPDEQFLGLWSASLNCGDGTLDPGEDCDDGDDVGSNVCTNTCNDAVCGDGLVFDQGGGTESCDDGVGDPGDGCDASCGIESGYQCPAPGMPCLQQLSAPDHYLGYKAKLPKIFEFENLETSLGKYWTVTVNDLQIADEAADDPENIALSKAKRLVNPVRKNDEADPDDPALHYIYYQAKSSKHGIGPAVDDKLPKAVKHVPRNWQLQNQLGTIEVTSKKRRGLLMPAATEIDDTSTQPELPEDATHYVCYQVKPAKVDTDQTQSGKFRKDLQAFFDDEFDDCATVEGGGASFEGTSVEGTCLLDLKKVVELCNPIDKEQVAPPHFGPPVRPSFARTDQSLLCYQARLAKKFSSADAAALVPGAAVGDVLSPRQTKHVGRSDILTVPVNNSYIPAVMDTKGQDVGCLPTEVLAVSEAP